MKTTINPRRAAFWQKVRSYSKPAAMDQIAPPRTALFREQLRLEVRRIMRNCAADGTTALGVDCLFNHLQFRNLSAAPSGTNARWVITQDLRDLAAAPEFHAFIIP